MQFFCRLSSRIVTTKTEPLFLLFIAAGCNEVILSLFLLQVDQNHGHLFISNSILKLTFSATLCDCQRVQNFTAIPYRVSTGPEQGFPCVLFPNREKPVFITGITANENRFFPVGKSTQGNPCFHYRDGFAVFLFM